MACIVSLFSGKEAVVRKQFTTVARGEDDFVGCAVTSPVFNSAVLGVVNEAKGNGFLCRDVGVKTAGAGRLLFWVNVYQTAYDGADSISANNNVMLSGFAVLECNEAGFSIDIDALELSCESCIFQLLLFAQFLILMAKNLPCG